MAGNFDPSEGVYFKAARNIQSRSNEHRSRPTKNTAPSPIGVRAVSDRQVFIRVIDECRQLAKNAQHQINSLVERNNDLQKQLAELVRKEARARHFAYHDGLTGLPNRSLLQDRFQQALSQAKRQHKPLALLLLDLNEFKRINEKLGHAGGDLLLQAVAQRLTQGIRSADTACRYGGDEFVIMLPEIDSPGMATALAVEIDARLSAPYIIDGHSIQIVVSIGVAVYPDDGQTCGDLIKQADSAMYRSKGTRRATSITALPTEDVGTVAVGHPPAPNHVDYAHVPEPQNKYQNMLPM